MCGTEQWFGAGFAACFKALAEFGGVWKNWLFAGSERAGQRAAAIQSLLATAKLNGLEPLAWLTDTLEKLPTWPKSRLDELLPLRSMAKRE
ncbi:MAG: transposase domain-containing protein [Moraxellaceae bacterium]|nr:transposase domain-containing protein [Moraxellaceae bacterium]